MLFQGAEYGSLYYFKIGKDYPGYFKNWASVLFEPDAKARLPRRLLV
jgi:hypothetical protein